MKSTATQQPAWTQAQLASNPHEAADKAKRVQDMFSAIADSYDINNRLHSVWQDQRWRRKAVAMAQVAPGDVVLDVACGTGDLSAAFSAAGAARVIGVDFTFNMLRVAQHKSETAHANAAALSYQAGDAMRLPLSDQSVDVVSIAFGIRNVSRPELALQEFHRVLRPGGRVIILEFSVPRNPVLRGLYNFYFRQIMPRTATLVAGDRSGAYRYLPRSVQTFIEPPQMVERLEQVGFGDCVRKPLTCGIAWVYRGVKMSDAAIAPDS